MSFDLAVGLHKAELDNISRGLYEAFPEEFKGTEQVEDQEIKFTVTWEIKTPATFTLSGSPTDPAAFEFTYQEVEVTLESPGVTTRKLPLTLTAQAKIAVGTDGSQSLDITGVKSAPPQDPVGERILQKAVLPKVLAAAQKVLGGVKVPPLQVPGVTISAPVPFVQEEMLIAIASLGTTPPPIPAPGAFPWPSEPLFLLLSEAGLQTAADYALSQISTPISDHGGGSIVIGSYGWEYNLMLKHLQVGVSGSNIHFTADAEGSASGSVHIPIIGEAGVNYEIKTKNISGLLKLVPEGSFLFIESENIEHAEIELIPTGSGISSLFAELVREIVQTVGGSFNSKARERLERLKVELVKIPTLQLQIGSREASITATGLSTIAAGGMLGLTGAVGITNSPPG